MAGLLLVVAMAGVVLGGLLGFGVLKGSGEPPDPLGAAAGTRSPSSPGDSAPSVSMRPPSEASSSPGAARPTATFDPSASPDLPAVPSPGASTGGTASAPTSAQGFKLRKTVIDLAFPFHATSSYHYSERFLAPRVGATRRYNHARGVTASGRLLRAHDGLDLRAKRGTRVYAGFSGTVIDPATRWKPWDPERYGNIVVVESDEPTSPGYVAFYAHLASTRVAIGDHVERGQWIGRVGNTGNASTEPPQLHVELRAPFRISVREGGRVRRIDAFDPYPSLVAADPKR